MTNHIGIDENTQCHVSFLPAGSKPVKLNTNLLDIQLYKCTQPNLMTVVFVTIPITSYGSRYMVHTMICITMTSLRVIVTIHTHI